MGELPSGWFTPIWDIFVRLSTLFQLIWQHHVAFIAVLPCYRMPSLNFVFRDLDMAAMHLSALVRMFPGTGLHLNSILFWNPIQQSDKI
jgi:hypothetical protein